MASYYRDTNGGASDEPMFVISVAARLVEMHPQTLRYYERAGLVKPKRSRGSIRLYSERDIERLRKIARLIDDLGVNLAGVEVIIRLTEKLEVMQTLLEQNQIQVPEAANEAQADSAPELAPRTPEKVKIQVRRPRSAVKPQALPRAQTKTIKEQS